MQDGRGSVGFQRDHQNPEPPVQPADGKAGPVTDRAVGVSRKRTGVRRGNGHFAEHAHHQHHQHAGGGVSQQNSRTCSGDGVTRADEQAGADNPGNRQHGHVARFEPLFEAIRALGTAH
ncbi:hypothetical protein D3C79_864540 [compost metagenome]